MATHDELEKAMNELDALMQEQNDIQVVEGDKITRRLKEIRLRKIQLFDWLEANLPKVNYKAITSPALRAELYRVERIKELHDNLKSMLQEKMLGGTIDDEKIKAIVKDISSMMNISGPREFLKERGMSEEEIEKFFKEEEKK